MGWAKYMEDNLEIIDGRLLQMEEERNRCSAEQVALNVMVPITPAVVAEKRPITLMCEKKYIICKNCGRVFTFFIRDQLFYEKMGWNPPKRCKACRERRKG